MSLACEHFGV
uniref:Uncharacterized protein n=1 Tax=Rhizophora mucronata TaxID=61149 RepID=A0A2P2PW68_RHIMU